MILCFQLFRFSNKDEEKFVLLSSDSNENAYLEAINVVLEAQHKINWLIEDKTRLFPISERVNFASIETSDFNEDVLKVFSCLEDVAQRFQSQTTTLKESIQEYLENDFLPKLKRLDILIILSAFVVRNKPFVDLFYNTSETDRKLKPGRELAKILAGSFMALFYKVVN